MSDEERKILKEEALKIIVKETVKISKMVEDGRLSETNGKKLFGIWSSQSDAYKFYFKKG